MEKIGLIAGSGTLPEEIIHACQARKQPIFVVAIEDWVDSDAVTSVPHTMLHVGQVSKALAALKSEQVDKVVLAGGIKRASLASLRPDFGGIKLIAKLAKLSTRGDDEVFSAIIQHIEKAGFTVVGADKVLTELCAVEGVYGVVKPDAIAEKDIALGMKVAGALGQLDVGQAVVVQQGHILAVEAIEGTDALVSRCKNLKQPGVGGVLVKMCKPNQDTRVDLPTIGIRTVEHAHASGLRGIAIQAGGALVLDKQKLIAKADELSMFVVGRQ